ncbi:prospero homeobox protein 2 isoform X1 [Girardinichthys multiradiatus]|uniref:prospero homeobox protein 2 isoform X1 n=1 Tax=Girardinichthys multiradiatus TaxID=208333 RepID=UPI001FAC7900|nr:prospero homeobox protein 2 isoform X1 [Girardinichthys multiradiatus]
MNLSLPDQNMHSSIEGCLEDDKPEVILPCFRRNLCEEPLAPYSNGSIISQLLRKTIHNKRVLDENHFYFSGSVATADCGQEDQSSVSSKDSTVEAVSPSDHTSSGASPEGEHPLTDHLQAKRARVENIIRVMAGSPNSRQHCDSERSDTDAQETREARESFRENKRKQRLPQHQDHSTAGWQIYRKPGRSSSDSCNTKEEECHKLKEQLHSMQRLLRQLQEKFLQVYSQEDPEYEAGDATGVDSEHDLLREGTDACYINPEERFETNNRTVAANCKDRMKAAYYLVHQRETPNLQETLKQELSKAVNDCIDRVFKNVSKDMDMSPQQCVYSSPEVQISLGTDRKSSPPDHSQTEEMPAKSGSSEYCESSETQTSQDQTEALSLVVRKPPVTQVGSVTPTVKRPYPMHQMPFQFSYTPPLHESHILEHLLKYGPHSNFGALPCMPPSMDTTSPDSVDLSWDAVAMRSKVTSSHFGHHHHRSSMGTVAVDGLCLPHVKMESGELQSLAERNPYMSLNIQEGLTPSHLKKAKLMFFYTRYPSSNVLKTFFPDVKFNRCITSQLIKWFSNFREFYYIQMEKFARQAIAEGVRDVKDITVSRDSELFRALNMHYNKANDFHVPNRFLEVAEITLHEFYNAISAAKDSDSSWKKAIYKVICKLDSEIPEEFKTSSYL